MLVEAQVTINGSKAAIWAAITNIENASQTISGIENIEVLEKPANGLVGLRWRETRMLFGKILPCHYRRFRQKPACENSVISIQAASEARKPFGRP